MKIDAIFTLLICFCLFSCNKSTPTQPSDPDTADSSEYTDNTPGTFVFTARGEKADCSGISEDGAYQNDAAFVHDFHGVNYLTITGNDYSAPKMHENSIKIDVVLQGELAEGSYTFVTPDVIADCFGEDGSGGDKICQGVVGPNADIYKDEGALEKVLESVSGTLQITKVSIGEYDTFGFAEGKISGSFSFSGTELAQFGQHPGTCTGYFKAVPLLVTK